MACCLHILITSRHVYDLCMACCLHTLTTCRPVYDMLSAHSDYMQTYVWHAAYTPWLHADLCMTCCLHTLTTCRPVYYLHTLIMISNLLNSLPSFDRNNKLHFKRTWQKKREKITKCVRCYHNEKSKEDDIFFSERGWKFTIANMAVGRMRFCVICLILSSIFHISFSRTAHDILEQETRDLAKDPEREAENEASEVENQLVSIWKVKGQQRNC